MMIVPRRSFYLVALLSCLHAVDAQAQLGAMRLHLESVQRFSGEEPKSGVAGAHWAWRSANEILLATSASSSLKLSGSFLKHEISANGRALLALEKSSEKNETPSLRLRWFDEQGAQRGAHALAWHEDDPLPHIILNEPGTHALVFEPATARAQFMEEPAQALREKFLFANAPHTNERPVFLAASANHFYALTQFAPSTSAQTHAPMLVCFSLTGEEQWRRELPYATAGHLAISPSGNWLAANAYEVRESRVNSSTALFDANGKPQATFSGNVRAVSFSTEETALLALDRRALRAIEINSGKILWQTQLQSRTEMFVALAAVQGSASCVALAGESAFAQNRFVFKKAKLLVYDKNGERQFAHAINEPLVKPRLVVAADQQQVLLAAEGWLQRYRLITTTQHARERNAQ